MMVWDPEKGFVPRRTPTKTQRDRFDSLRARYKTADLAIKELESSFRSRYGSMYESHWLSNADRRKIHLKRAARRRVEESIFRLLAEISPRDWMCGAPAYWVCESLSWDDAIRPTSELLSVVPPLSYGATEPKR